jgi:hypothetical protein
MELTGRRERRSKQLPDDPKEKRGYYKLKEEALYRAVWRIRFAKCFGIVRRTIELIN